MELFGHDDEVAHLAKLHETTSRIDINLLINLTVMMQLMLLVIAIKM